MNKVATGGGDSSHPPVEKKLEFVHQKSSYNM